MPLWLWGWQGSPDHLVAAGTACGCLPLSSLNRLFAVHLLKQSRVGLPSTRGGEETGPKALAARLAGGGAGSECRPAGSCCQARVRECDRSLSGLKSPELRTTLAVRFSEAAGLVWEVRMDSRALWAVQVRVQGSKT